MPEHLAISPDRIVGDFAHLPYLIGALPSAIVVLDREQRCLLANQRWLEDYDLQNTDIVGKRLDDLFPDFPASWRTRCRQALAGETLDSQDERSESLRGIVTYQSWRVFPWSAQPGEAPAGIVIVMSDTTDMMAAQIKREMLLTSSAETRRHRAEVISEVTKSLSEATSAQAILNAFFPLVANTGMMFSSLNYFETDANGGVKAMNTVAAQAGNGEILSLSTFPATRFEIDKFPLLRMVVQHPDTPMFIEDMHTDPLTQSDNPTREVSEAFGISAYIALPFKTGDQWQGLLFFTWAEPKTFDAELREVLTAIVPMVSTVVANRRLLIAQEATSRKFEVVAEVNAALAQASDEQGILDAVSAFTERYGVLFSSLTYFEHPYVDEPDGIDIVAARSGDGNLIPLSALPATHFNRELLPLLELPLANPDEPVFCENVFIDPRTEKGFAREFAKATNITAFIFVPLKTADVWHGVIAFNWGGEQKFDAEIRDVLTTIMPTAAAVVASRRLYLETVENVLKLRELDRLKNEFISTMSHELRTPLNAVIGLSDVMLAGLNGDLNERMENDVRTIYNAGQQLLGIVNDVLDIAKIEAGTLELRRTPVNVPPIIEEVAATTRASADSKQVTIHVNAPNELPAVRADANRLRQIITNLLSNAVKFTDVGTVEVNAYVEEGALVVCVSDQGIGIAPEHQGLIFEHFRQVEGSINRRKGGAGLGLPISQRLVQLHGGKMWLTSEVGKGSKFYFSLPIQQG